MNVATDIVHYPADKEKITALISSRQPDQVEKVEGTLRYKTAKVKNDETPSTSTWNKRRRGDIGSVEFKLTPKDFGKMYCIMCVMNGTRAPTVRRSSPIAKVLTIRNVSAENWRARPMRTR